MGWGGPSPAEQQATEYNKYYQHQLDNTFAYGRGIIDNTMGKMDGLNNNINDFINNLPNQQNVKDLQNMIKMSMEGKNVAEGKGFSAAAGIAQAYGLDMRGKTFAEQFGANLGAFNVNNATAKSIAEKLASTTENPFAVLNNKFLEDAALQAGAQTDQLRTQLAAQGLDPSSGTGAAALAALQTGVNKNLLDAQRQNTVAAAQFQQQGMGMGANILNALSGLDLQRASTEGQLGVSGYQADIQNAGRYDQVSMANAQNQTQANIATANNMTQASLQNASFKNASMNAGLQAQLGLFNGMNQAALGGYGIQSGNLAALLGLGGNLYGAGIQGMGNLAGQYNQNAQANAQGQGNLFGGGLSFLGNILPAIITAVTVM